MLKTVSSMKYQKDISYYTEDITESGMGIHCCTGYADDDGGVYEITFDKRGENYYLKDIEEV